VSIDSAEKSTYGANPWEGYWFSCGPLNFYYTGNDTEQTVNGHLYTRETISHTEIEQNQEMRSGSIEVSLPLDNPVALLFRDYLPVRPVGLVLYRAMDGETGVIAHFTGIVSSHKVRETMTLVCVSDQDALKKRIPALRYQIQCPRRLFSPLCGVNKAAFMTLAEVSSVSGKTVKSSTFASKVDDYFKGGMVEVPALGAVMAVSAHAGDTLTLFHSVAGLEAGAMVVAYPGCGGTESECASKFGNLVNHLGFSHIPSTNPFGERGIA